MLFLWLLCAFVLFDKKFEVNAYVQPKDEQLLNQFYNYVDIITDFKLNNMLKITQTFTQQLLDSIPYDERGNTAELLQNYIDNAENLRYYGGTAQEKEALLLELQQLIATIRSGLAQQEHEDVILRRGLLGMFELLARLSIEERRHVEKFRKAAEHLKRHLPPEAIEKHREILEVINQVAIELDIVQREKLFKRFRELRKTS